MILKYLYVIKILSGYFMRKKMNSEIDRHDNIDMGQVLSIQKESNDRHTPLQIVKAWTLLGPQQCTRGQTKMGISVYG